MDNLENIFLCSHYFYFFRFLSKTFFIKGFDNLKREEKKQNSKYGIIRERRVPLKVWDYKGTTSSLKRNDEFPYLIIFTRSDLNIRIYLIYPE